MRKVHMNQKMLSIAAIVTAAALTGIFSTNPMAAYADESETNTDQSTKQKNVGTGDSINFNCAQNLIKASVGEQTCGTPEEEIMAVGEEEEATADGEEEEATDAN
ncbi:MAG: hypothetical protein ACRD42_00730 [Nitrososphaeraceae archaeon]